jgi:hypothetical protein
MTPCEIARAQSIVSSMEQSVANAQAASGSIAGPSSFAQLGPAVVIDVARSQNAMTASSSPVPTSSPSLSVRSEIQAAPTVYPLNVSPQEYSGCGYRSGALVPVRVAPQVVTMPQRAPQPVSVPQNAVQPKYKNLCWGLRNGMVTQEQFDPAEYMAMYIACSQKGYTQGCSPPPLVALWQAQQRKAGTLPHITVRQSDLDAIPHAPDMSQMGCAQSLVQGMAGYRRGLGAVWGDAGSLPTTAAWPAANVKGTTAVNWSALLVFAALGVGLYAMGRR